MLEKVEWGEFKLGDLFDSFNGDFDIQKEHINGLGDYVVTAGLTDNGILGKTDIEAKIFEKNTITVDMFGFAFFRQFRYKIVTHARVFSLKAKTNITANQGLFLVSSFHFLNTKFGYGNMCSWSKIKDEKISLPTKNGEIDFEFMESFIEELESAKIQKLDEYLENNGFKDCTLTTEEEKVLRDFESGKVEWSEFKYKDIFNKIVQGRRLKKDDQIEGDIPFVMAGITNTGIVNYISNPIASFPKNSITVDIFGNTFYRNYDFGAGDDTGVYWSDEIDYSQKNMLFFSSSIGKSLIGKFDYGTKLRSSQSYDFLMQLPTLNSQPNYCLMETLISAVQKLVIRGVVEYIGNKNRSKK